MAVVRLTKGPLALLSPFSTDSQGSGLLQHSLMLEGSLFLMTENLFLVGEGLLNLSRS